MTKRAIRIPSLSTIGPDTPLRLDVAAALAFPEGGIGVRGLKREAQRGRLVIERIAGKDFTTLAAIADMRVLCRVESVLPPTAENIPPKIESTNMSPSRLRLQMVAEQLKKRVRDSRR